MRRRISSCPEVVERKLKSPGLQLTKEESIECLTSCISVGKARAEQAKDRHLIMVIGNTGAGKSTLVNYIAGCKMEMVPRKDVGLSGKGKIVRVAADSPITEKEMMRIGHDNTSATFLPEARARTC